jgi:hypothetical protein
MGPPDDPSFGGCGSDSVSTAVTTGAHEPVPVEGSACDAVVTVEAQGGAGHIGPCTTIAYATNPPSSGVHYNTWAAFAIYDRPVARGYWVHSLEHGAIAFLHNCRNCEDEIEAAATVISELPEDPACVGQAAARRVLMTPDPLLDVPWAAAAWGVTLRANCFEPEVFRAFATEYYGQGREDTCAAGRSF